MLLLTRFIRFTWRAGTYAGAAGALQLEETEKAPKKRGHSRRTAHRRATAHDLQRLSRATPCRVSFSYPNT